MGRVLHPVPGRVLPHGRAGVPVVAVLHDLAQAARFASGLGAVGSGRVLTADLVRRVFGLARDVIADPRTGTPLVIPHERRH